MLHDAAQKEDPSNAEAAETPKNEEGGGCLPFCGWFHVGTSSLLECLKTSPYLFIQRVPIYLRKDYILSISWPLQDDKAPASLAPSEVGVGAWGWEPVFFLNTISINIYIYDLLQVSFSICIYVCLCQELLKRSDFQQKTGITFKVRMFLEEYTYRPARQCCMMRHKKKIQALPKQQKHRRMRRGGCLHFFAVGSIPIQR